MKTLVTIGHETLVLGTKKNASDLVKALEGAIEVDWDYRSKSDEKEYFVGDPVKIEIQQVKESQFKLKPGCEPEALERLRQINGARVNTRQIAWRRA